MSRSSPQRAVSDAVSAAARKPRGSRADVLGRGLRLEYFSLAYNLLEAAVGVAAGVVAGSVALVGFGLDSVVESLSAATLIWRLRSERSGRRTSEDAERRAVRLVAVAFFVLAIYVAVKSGVDLLGRARPDESVVGIALAAVSLVIMPALANAKRRAAREMDSRALQADSTQTSLCTFISGALLVGLVANAAFGWWWADPVAGMVIAFVAVREGRELWLAEDFCCL
jgi:divalent metal cation (Fe/Co/Zn/Cd) transporter